MLVDVLLNRLLQLGDAAERTAFQPLLREVAESAFDQVQLRTAGGREVQMEPGMSRQPRQDFRMLVRGVVVGDEMQVQLRRRLGVDPSPSCKVGTRCCVTQPRNSPPLIAPSTTSGAVSPLTRKAARNVVVFQ